MLVQWDVLHPESPGIALLDAGEPIFSIWQNPETSVLWIGTSYGKVLVFDLMTRTLIQSFLFPGTGIFSITRLSGTLLVCTTGDGRWLCFHPQTHQFTGEKKWAEGKIRTLKSNGEGIWAMGTSAGEIILGTNETETNRFQAHDWPVNDIAWYGNHTLISGGKDAWLKTWKFQGVWELQEAVPAHNYAIYAVFRLGKKIITASRDKHIKIWSGPDLKPEQRIDAIQGGGHRFSVNTAIPLSESRFATGGDDREIRIWECQ